MLKHCLILFAAVLSYGCMSASAGVVTYLEDFESGTVAGFVDGSYSDMSGGAGMPNADTPSPTTSVAGGVGSANGLLLETVMFDAATNPSWAGTQVTSPNIAGSAFTGALNNVTMGMDFSVIADAGSVASLRFELRESGAGGITTHAVFVPVSDIIGGLNNYSFSLDQNQTGAFSTRGTGIDTTRDHQIFVQVQENWALTGSTRQVDVTMDNFMIMAAAVPEPSSLVILGSLGLLGMVRRRR